MSRRRNGRLELVRDELGRITALGEVRRLVSRGDSPIG
jgi:hypothetical protein